MLIPNPPASPAIVCPPPPPPPPLKSQPDTHIHIQPNDILYDDGSGGTVAALNP